MIPPERPCAVVLDIEGTTTPISFVYDVLFPFARRRLANFLDERWTSPEVGDAVIRLRAEWEEDVARSENPPAWPDNRSAAAKSSARYLEWLMDRDRKSPALKLVQGYIWQGGYTSGALRGEVFEDVPPALARWKAAGLTIAIYSSGSTLAQRLLFTHTTAGDLTPSFSGFFDTSVGPKVSSTSYRHIAKALGCAAEGVLFVSDSRRELDAAREAGCRVLLCIRPGNSEQDRAGVEVIGCLDEVPCGCRTISCLLPGCEP